MHYEDSAAKQALLDTDPVVLSRIRHLDLTKVLKLQGSRVVSSGAYGDVFKCRCMIKGRGEVEVAGKRLRFHVATLDFKKVCSSLLHD